MKIANKCPCCGGKKIISETAVLMPFIAHRIFDWIPIEIDQSWNLRTIKTGKLYSICKTLGCELCNHIF